MSWCVFLGYFRTQKGYRCWNLVGRKYVICSDISFFENTPYVLASLNSTITLSIIVTLHVPLEDSSLLQVYRRKTHHSIALTEVSGFPIALWKSTRSCTQHPITKVLSFSFTSFILYFCNHIIFYLSQNVSVMLCLDLEWKMMWIKRWCFAC